MTRGSVLVVGAGVMGCATARYLARRDVHVTLLEQFHVGHKRGSSHGSSRIFRFSYPDARYVAMAMQALPLWRDLEREVDEPLLQTTGGLETGPDLADNAAALKACGAALESVDARQARLRWPQLTLPDEGEVLYQPDAGVLLADRAVKAFTQSFVAAGGAVREGVAALSVRTSAAGVHVDTTAGAFDVDALVVTAGAWVNEILEPLGLTIPVRPTRETVAYFEYSGSPFPAVVEWGSPPVYALLAPGYGIKAGEHEAGPTTDPDEQGIVNEASVERLKGWLGERFPDVSPNPVYSETCIYTNTPDDSFILKRTGRVVVGSPCSGHGFKFAPLIGEQLAELALQALD